MSDSLSVSITPSPEFVPTMMSQFNISVNESVNKFVSTDEINEKMTNFTYFYTVTDYDNYENHIPNNSQKVIEK